jgi:hypothetical protein
MTARSIIITAGVILAFGLAIYLGNDWPVKAIVWADEIAPAIVGSKALAKVAVILGAASGLLWAMFPARKK